MRFWILDKDLNSYIQLCQQERIDPSILEKLEDKDLVNMTANMINTWNMVGYWYEMA